MRVEINGDGKIHKQKQIKRRFDITCLILGHPFIKMIMNCRPADKASFTTIQAIFIKITV